MCIRSAVPLLKFECKLSVDEALKALARLPASILMISHTSGHTLCTGLKFDRSHRHIPKQHLQQFLSTPGYLAEHNGSHLFY